MTAGAVLLLWPTEKAAEQSSPSVEEYRSMLEKQTEELIAGLDGIKDCKVLITLESGYEYLYASDQTLVKTYSENGTLLGSTATKEYFSDSGGGAAVITESMPVISGIAVVAKGAGADLRYRIIELLQAAYGLPGNRISVQS